MHSKVDCQRSRSEGWVIVAHLPSNWWTYDYTSFRLGGSVVPV